jgi:hypothetical protein
VNSGDRGNEPFPGNQYPAGSCSLANIAAACPRQAHSFPPRSDGRYRWEVIRYALRSNARTARLCVLWVVVTGGPVAGTITYWILHIR